MEYPYDVDSFSPLLKAYLRLIRSTPAAEVRSEMLLGLINAETPPEAAALLHTLAHHDWPHMSMGWRHLHPRHSLCTAEGTMESANIHSDAPLWFDPKRSLEIGSSAGGEVYFGFHWGNGTFRFHEIDFEWESYGEPPIKVFDNADEFWKKTHYAEEDHGTTKPAFFEKLFGMAPAQ